MELIMNEQYKTLSSNSKILYSLFLNRTNYSKKNLKKFSDKNGIYIYYSNSQIQKHLHCSVHTAVNVLSELEQAGLIKREYQKRGLPLKIYVSDIRAENKDTYSASEKPQDKLSHRPYLNSNYNKKPHTDHSVKEEKQVSFDVDLEEKLAKAGLVHFSRKKQKRQTQNSCSTF